jgi:hypothetical protein
MTVPPCRPRSKADQEWINSFPAEAGPTVGVTATRDGCTLCFLWDRLWMHSAFRGTGFSREEAISGADV